MREAVRKSIVPLKNDAWVLPFFYGEKILVQRDSAESAEIWNVCNDISTG